MVNDHVLSTYTYDNGSMKQPSPASLQLLRATSAIITSITYALQLCFRRISMGTFGIPLKRWGWGWRDGSAQLPARLPQ